MSYSSASQVTSTSATLSSPSSYTNLSPHPYHTITWQSYSAAWYKIEANCMPKWENKCQTYHLTLQKEKLTCFSKISPVSKRGKDVFQHHCIRSEKVCRDIRSKKCSSRRTVQRSVCSKLNCRDDDDQKLTMLLAATAKNINPFQKTMQRLSLKVLLRKGWFFISLFTMV